MRKVQLTVVHGSRFCSDADRARALTAAEDALAAGSSHEEAEAAANRAAGYLRRGETGS